MEDEQKVYNLYGSVEYIRAQVDRLLAEHKDYSVRFDKHLAEETAERQSIEKRLDDLDTRIGKLQVKIGAIATGITLAVQFVAQFIIRKF